MRIGSGSRISSCSAPSSVGMTSRAKQNERGIMPTTFMRQTVENDLSAEVLEQMIASPNYSVALLGIKAKFIRFRLIEKY